MTCRFFRVEHKVLHHMLSSSKVQDSIRRKTVVWISPNRSEEGWSQQGGKASPGNEWSRATDQSLGHTCLAIYM